MSDSQILDTIEDFIANNYEQDITFTNSEREEILAHIIGLLENRSKGKV